MPRKHVVAVVGPDAGSEALLGVATEVGRMIAEAGYVLLTGGRDRGIMDAAAKGAQVGPMWRTCTTPAAVISA